MCNITQPGNIDLHLTQEDQKTTQKTERERLCVANEFIWFIPYVTTCSYGSVHYSCHDQETSCHFHNWTTGPCD